MNGLLPIIRRIRRPLLPEEPRVTTANNSHSVCPTCGHPLPLAQAKANSEVENASATPVADQTEKPVEPTPAPEPPKTEQSLVPPAAAENTDY